MVALAPLLANFPPLQKGARARWLARACVRACVVQTKTTTAGALRVTSPGFSEEFVSLLTSATGKHLRSLSGLDKWLIRPEVELVQVHNWVSAGRLSVISEEARNADGPVRPFFFLCTRERACAVLGSGAVTLIQHTSGHPSPPLEVTGLFIKMEMESCCPHVRRQTHVIYLIERVLTHEKLD